MIAAMDAIPAMIAAMDAAGCAPDEPIAQQLGSGDLVRFRVNGDKRRNGWARLHLDGRPAGAFGRWGGVRQNWKMDGDWKPLSPTERLRQRRKIDQERAERTQATADAQEAASRLAGQIWAAAGPVDPAHPYAVLKRLTGEGLRQHNGRIIVPMYDAAGRLWNVQRIGADRSKLFLKGGRTRGLMWRVGRPNGEAAIGEGVATVAAVRRATGLAVAAAFSAENLEAVARAIRSTWPSLGLVICADDDAHLVDHPTIRRNLGADYAQDAAAAVGARVALPPRGA
jgi:putative DNA primase/helicase